MPTIKKSQTKKIGKAKTSQVKAQEVKKNLINDLNQFLVDKKIPNKDIKTEKQKALSELDKLIKQDLSYGQLLSTLKKDVNKNLDQANHKKDSNEADTLPSSHVLDLRQSIQEPKIKKQRRLLNLKKNFSRPKINLQEKRIKKSLHIPTKTKVNWNFSLPEYGLKIGSRLLAFALIVFVVLLPIRGLVWVGEFQGDTNKIFDFSKQGLVNLQTGAISASENSYLDAQADFDEALINFQKAQEVLKNQNDTMVEIVKRLPLVGKPVSLSDNLLSVATNISEAASILNKKMQDGENPTVYLELVDSQITKTLPYLKAANKDLSNISVSLLPENVRPYFAQLKAYLPTAVENLENLQDIFGVLSKVLGHDTEKRYLVIFQNNNELRATGGFMGSFALFDVYQGKITNLEVAGGGLYDLEAGQISKIKAPKALSLINPNFNIWDANWWYDFPTSAQKIISFYQNGGGSSVDGLISVNAEVLKDLLQVLGPVEMPEYELTITSENVFAVLQEQVEFKYDPEINEPKAIIRDLLPVLLERLLESGGQQKEIAALMAGNLSNKNIQVYLTDSETQRKIYQLGWAGQAASNNRDYLAVINTNIAGGKTDREIEQLIDHQAEINEKGEIINTVRITRTNSGATDNPLAGIEGGNVSYIRIYVPLGSEFIEGIGFDKIPESYFRVGVSTNNQDPDIAKEEEKMIDSVSNVEIYQSLDKTVFANWMTLGPGESKTVAVKYKLPFQLDFSDPLTNNWFEEIFKENLKLNTYSLVVQSQSGQLNSTFNSSVILPKQVKIVFNEASDKQFMNITDNLITYTNSLDGDQYFGFILASQ